MSEDVEGEQLPLGHRHSIGRRTVVWSLVSVLGPVAIYFLLPLDGDRWLYGVGLGLLAVVAIVPLTVRHLRAIDGSATPLANALRALALLLGLAVAGFATINYAVAANTEDIPGLRTKIDGLYFTIVTMTSVGFGDIAPKGQAARAMVTLQIVLTITLLGGAFRLISNVTRQARDQS